MHATCNTKVEQHWIADKAKRTNKYYLPEQGMVFHNVKVGATIRAAHKGLKLGGPRPARP